MLEGQTENSGRNAGDDDQPREALGRGLGSPLAEGAKKGGDDLDPIVAVVDEQSEGAAHVEHDDERQPVGFRLGLGLDHPAPAEEGGVKDGVPEAGDREQLGDALKNAEDDRLQVADGGGDREAEGGQGGDSLRPAAVT